MEGDYEDLYKWIEEHSISRPKRNINRDFSDAVPLAEVLKHHYPKLVDLHNYSSRNSHIQKVVNWETLNNRVLKRLKINLSKKRIDQLARGETGAIEKLLLEIKKKIDSKIANNENFDISYIDQDQESNSPRTKSLRKFVPIAAVDKIKAELDEKSEAVTILKNKVEHLESLLSLKEERIKDLAGQLQTIVDESATSPSVSKFFGFFQTGSGHRVQTKSAEEL